MIDHVERIKTLIKGELAQSCTKLGIDKSEAGFYLSGFGAIEVVVNQEEQSATPMPVWAVFISLRSLLLGQGPVGGRLQIPGVLPPDEHFRLVVQRLLAEVDKQRMDEFNGRVNQ
jgi:hypothetical protein